MSLTDESDREQLSERGYVVLEDVVPAEHCDAVVEDIWSFLGMDPDDPETWYRPPEGMDEPFSSAGIVELYHAQSLWDVRQHPAVYQAFAELLGEERLWVSIDRVNMTPPARADAPAVDRALDPHWDADVSDLPEKRVQPHGTAALPWGLQGVVHLADTGEDQGGFSCYPGVFRDIDDLAREGDLDAWAREFDPSETEYEEVSVAGGKGDLLVWDRRLFHGNGRNRAAEPRLAQYVLMYPERFADHERRAERTASWRERAVPPGDPFPGDPREREKDHPPADLTPLGRKLLGCDPWQGWSD